MPQNGNICVLWVTLAITYSAWLWTRTAIVSLPQLTLWRCLYLCSAASLSAAVGFGLSWLALAARVAVLASSSGLLIAIFFSAQRCRHLWPERLKLVQGSAWAGLAGRGGIRVWATGLRDGLGSASCVARDCLGRWRHLLIHGNCYFGELWGRWIWVLGVGKLRRRQASWFRSLDGWKHL